MQRRDLLKSAVPAALGTMVPAQAEPQATPKLPSQRSFWVDRLDTVSAPVLKALSQRKLKALMPVEAHKGEEASRRRCTYLEAFGRLLSGMAPWLEHGAGDGAEGVFWAHSKALVQESLAAGVDPKSPDYLDFGGVSQTLVDTAFLALAILRAPKVLNADLPSGVKRQLADALRAVRVVQPSPSNWLLFAAGVEAALHALGEPWDRMRVDYALREHMTWYVGDGTYGDGPHFHWDYYNSFVIQPFLLAVLDEVGHEHSDWKAMVPKVKERATRYAHVQERLIAPDGSYPVIGRSIAYRCGAFQLLADVALRHALPEDLSPEQVRCALAATIHRTLTPSGTFDAQGWLRIGLAGHQPALGESYISTGSLYLCANAFLPLGLPPDDRFWSAPDAPWSSQKLWSGEDMPNDHAVDG